jgi:hypothetical protein
MQFILKGWAKWKRARKAAYFKKYSGKNLKPLERSLAPFLRARNGYENTRWPKHSMDKNRYEQVSRQFLTIRATFQGIVRDRRC